MISDLFIEQLLIIMKTKKNNLNILVTGVGSELAFSIIKALQLSELDYCLIGTDISLEVVGKYWCDIYYQIPMVIDEEKYISKLKEIITNEGITIVIPTVDKEFFVLPKYKGEFKEQLGCHFLINEWEEINTFNDKWKSYLWYLNNNIPTPKTYLIDDFNISESGCQQIDFPMIVKPREGGGSRSIYKINSIEDIIKYGEIVSNPIFQEYLFPDDEEYTAGVYKTLDNEVFSIVFKRTLKFGMTNTAEVVNSEILNNFVKDILLKTNLIGSNNIQFRVTSNGPKVLEINPRFSGTTAIRAKFGFNDVEFWINEVLYESKLKKNEIKEGFVLRFMEEQYHFK